MNKQLLWSLLLLSACSEPLCSSRVLQIARDPGSDRYAVTEVRNCGATTDYATVVRIGRASESQSSAREVFAADSNHGEAAYGLGGRDTIWTGVGWTASGHLDIAYSSRARVFKHVAATNGAAITYRATDPLDSPPVP